MDIIAEGLAAHWKYGGSGWIKKLDRLISWVREALDNQNRFYMIL